MPAFPCQINEFPCKYLGIPLSPRKLNKSDWQPLLDELARRLAAWNGSADRGRQAYSGQNHANDALCTSHAITRFATMGDQNHQKNMSSFFQERSRQYKGR
jgi:hypothetical protein